MVQGGTWRYTQWQATAYGGTWRYKAVQESFKSDGVLVRASTYWHVLILTVQSGFPAGFAAAILPGRKRSIGDRDRRTSASNHTNASSSMFQSTASGPAAGFVTSPALFGGGRRQRLFFGGRCCGFRRRGWRRCSGGSSSVGRGLYCVGVGVVGGYGHGTTGGSGTDVVLVTNLRDKSLAAGRPPAQDFLRMFS